MAYIFPVLIIFTSPHEHSAAPIPIVFGLALNTTKPIALAHDKELFQFHK